jgi:hypothetical protein
MWISKEAYEKLKAETDALLESLKTLEKRSYLIGIERSGRNLYFTFARGDKVHQVQVMSMMSDNLPKWKEDLLR